MKNLTYPMYVEDEAVREQLERDVRRLRAEAVQAGLRAIARAIFRRTSVFKLKTA